MGKDYAGTHHTELFSCGMEAITHGRFGCLTGRPSIFLPAPGGLTVADCASRQKPTPSTWPSSSDCWPQPTNASREPGDKKAPDRLKLRSPRRCSGDHVRLDPQLQRHVRCLIGARRRYQDQRQPAAVRRSHATCRPGIH
jgi:hypothetical protein